MKISELFALPNLRLDRRQVALGILAPVIALMVALFAGELLIIIYGASPLKIFSNLISGTWGNFYGIGQTLFKTTPLILAGLAVAIPFRAGLFNVGGEGQVVLGSLATAVVGLYLPAGTPSIIAIPCCALAGFSVGALWGALAGYLKARCGAHEVISTIMLNFIAIALSNYFIVKHLAPPETVHSNPIIDSARLSRISSYVERFQGSALNTSFFIVLLICALCYWLLFRSRLGYQLRTLGHSVGAAEYAGINTRRMMTISMAIGGGLAGLVGMNFVQGYKYYYEDGFSGGIGFMGIAVAMLGRNHPGGIILAALLFGTLSQGGFSINALIPKEIVDVLQAVIILAVVASAREVQRVITKEAK